VALLALAMAAAPLAADSILLDDYWSTGVRTVQNLPTRSAWYSSSTDRLYSSVGSLTGVLEGSSRLWLTYFTDGEPFALADDETLRVSVTFTPQGVNAGNSNYGLRVGLFNYADGTRVPADGMSSSGANGAGVEGYLLNMNFAPSFGVNNPLQIRRRVGTSSDNLMGSVPGSPVIYSDPLATGGGVSGAAGFQSGVTYRLDFSVTRNGAGAEVTVRISDATGWLVEVSALDADAPVTAFDALAIRPATDAQTAASFVFSNVAVRVVNDGSLPDSDRELDPDPLAGLYAMSQPLAGDWRRHDSVLGLYWSPAADMPYIYAAAYGRWLLVNRSLDERYFLHDPLAGYWWIAAAAYAGNLWNFHEGYWYYHDGVEFIERGPEYGVDFDLTIPEPKRALFIATDGSDANDGSAGAPFASLAKAAAVAEPGDVIRIAPGVYTLSQTVRIQRSGTITERIYLVAGEGGAVVLDFSAQPFGGSQRGIELPASYWHIRGITVRGAGDNGFFVTGSHNVLNQCVATENRDSGFQLDNGASYNLVINCDSYRNFDAPTAGENADGFAAKFNIGPGNVFHGCRAWENADDGWDLWRAPEGVVIEHCWAFRNGVNIWGADPFTGNGNGFKLGGDQVAGNHLVRRNLAFANTRRGFDQNNNTGVLHIIHNTAYDQPENFWFPNNSPFGTSVFRNNLSFQGSNRAPSAADLAGNSWQGHAVFATHFVSLDVAEALQPRQADGSLPAIGLLRLAPGAFVIDAGVDIGEPFLGAAPDIGAYEFGTDP
jgi:hypothetical protein